MSTRGEVSMNIDVAETPVLNESGLWKGV